MLQRRIRPAAKHGSGEKWPNARARLDVDRRNCPVEVHYHAVEAAVFVDRLRLQLASLFRLQERYLVERVGGGDPKGRPPRGAAGRTARCSKSLQVGPATEHPPVLAAVVGVAGQVPHGDVRPERSAGAGR